MNTTDKRLNEKIVCQLDILTPVHIGSGNVWQEGVDFIVFEDTIYKVNPDLFFNALDKTEAGNGQSGLDKMFRILESGRPSKVSELCQQLDLDPEEFSEYTFQTEKLPAPQIRALARTGMGVPMIPGSSLKGAIRSVMLHHLHRRLQGSTTDKFIVKKLLGDFETAITRYFHPSDVEIRDKAISNIDTFNLYMGGMAPRSDYKKNLPITVEHFMPGKAKGALRLAVEEGWIAKLGQINADALPHNIRYIFPPGVPAIPHLFHLINEYTWEHLDREITFFKAFPQAPDTPLLIENLEKLQSMTANNPDFCVLRLAYGSGFHGITGDWRFKDHVSTIRNPDFANMIKREPARYKSRKVVGEDIHTNLMGFVKITLPEAYPRIPFQPRHATTHAKLATDSSQPAKTLTPQGTARHAYNEIEEVLKPMVVEEPNYEVIDFAGVGEKSLIYAKIVALRKPFSQVELLLENYPFEDKMADMSGTKGYALEVGQIVPVLVNSRAKTGKINTVALKFD